MTSHVAQLLQSPVARFCPSGRTLYTSRPIVPIYPPYSLDNSHTADLAFSPNVAFSPSFDWKGSREKPTPRQQSPPAGVGWYGPRGNVCDIKISRNSKLSAICDRVKFLTGHLAWPHRRNEFFTPCGESSERALEPTGGKSPILREIVRVTSGEAGG